MQESYGEGLATHTGPESCGDAREGGAEALTGVLAGQVLSRESHAPPRGGFVRGADAVEEGGRPRRERRSREAPTDPARSEALCTQGNTSRGNREIPRLSVAMVAADRIGKSKDTRR
jgi:RNA-directed DNA polymerase